MEKSKSLLWVLVAVAAVVVVFLLVVNGDDDKKETSNNQNTSQQTTEKPAEQPKGILGPASATESLSTLVSAVKAADLVATLQGEGPFTVFAPTNEAFAALPAGTLDSLLKPENKATLSGILTYHVVAGKVMAADLKDGQEVVTVQGTKLTVKLMDAKAYLIDAKGNQIQITQTDISASNGVVHVIGGVLLPS